MADTTTSESPWTLSNLIAYLNSVATTIIPPLDLGETAYSVATNTTPAPNLTTAVGQTYGPEIQAATDSVSDAISDAKDSVSNAISSILPSMTTVEVTVVVVVILLVLGILFLGKVEAL